MTIAGGFVGFLFLALMLLKSRVPLVANILQFSLLSRTDRSEGTKGEIGASKPAAADQPEMRAPAETAQNNVDFTYYTPPPSGEWTKSIFMVSPLEQLLKAEHNSNSSILKTEESFVANKNRQKVVSLDQFRKKA